MKSSTSLSDSSRRVNSRPNDCDDRISNLPESIIGHILSFLETKEAVATSVLSKRWVFLWRNVSNLGFCYPGGEGEEKENKSSEFIQFVNYVMLFHNSGCLNKFSLIWKHYCAPFYVNAWIRAAIDRNVHNLFINVFYLPIQVQRNIFSCQGLQSLELNCEIAISPKIVVSLPKLENLKLISVYFKCDEDFSKLLAGCPVLKYLHIDMNIRGMLRVLPIDDADDADDAVVLQCHVPRGMFSCNGLQSLELNGEIYIPSEIVISLPKLESLKLMSVFFLLEETLQKLVSGCPMLKYLFIDMDIWNIIPDYDDDGIAFKFVVSSTTLRHLELHVHDGSGEAIDTIQLHAPSLEYMILKGISSISIHGSLSSLFEAKIKTNVPDYQEQGYCNSVVEAVSVFHHVDSLTLSGDFIWALCFDIDFSQAVSKATNKLRTKFKRLRNLKVTKCCCYWGSLQDFINLSIGLEALIVKKQDLYGGCFHPKTSNWRKPNQVPECLSNSLKTVSFNGYDGGDDELAMIGYILSHGNALKVMKICFDKSIKKDFKTKCELVQQISEFPRKSPVCKVVFH